MTRAARTALAERLLAWYDRHRRDLSWRRRRGAWPVWVSEVMLQQTRVETVERRFDAFLARFPAPQALADCSDDDLLTAWQGLGYYRRARLLREGARVVVERHGGTVPRDPALLRALPGVGAYTAGAIASIAFGARAAAIDGNVERVIARHAGIAADPKGREGRAQLRRVLDAVLPETRCGDFNQALMDLGATLCTPRNPRCGRCPLAGDCSAAATGRQHELPLAPLRRAPIAVAARAVVVPAGDGRVLGARIESGEINHGQIELPGPGVLADHPTPHGVPDAVLARHGAELRIGAEIARVRHGITHHRITLHVHLGELLGGAGALMPFAPDDPRVPWSTPSRKALAKWNVGG